MSADAMTGGFADPVFQSQAVFRSVLDGFSRPGTIVEVGDFVQPPAPLYRPAAAFVATLADEGTPVYVDTALAHSDAAVNWIRFHTDAPITETPGAATFAVIAEPTAMPPLNAFAHGSGDYPDRSTTLVIQVESVSRETLWNLQGPGIDGFATLSADPLPTGFLEQMNENRALYPRGVDIVLASPTALAALPRSIRVRDGRAG